MTTYRNIPDSEIDADSPLLQMTMFALRDNLKAVVEQDPTAPSLNFPNSQFRLANINNSFDTNPGNVDHEFPEKVLTRIDRKGFFIRPFEIIDPLSLWCDEPMDFVARLNRIFSVGFLQYDSGSLDDSISWLNIYDVEINFAAPTSPITVNFSQFYYGERLNPSLPSKYTNGNGQWSLTPKSVNVDNIYVEILDFAPLSFPGKDGITPKIDIKFRYDPITFQVLYRIRVRNTVGVTTSQLNVKNRVYHLDTN